MGGGGPVDFAGARVGLGRPFHLVRRRAGPGVVLDVHDGLDSGVASARAARAVEMLVDAGQRRGIDHRNRRSHTLPQIADPATLARSRPIHEDDRA